MKIPTWILSVALAGFTAWAGWMSLAVVELKTELAGIRATLAVKTSFANTP